MKYLTLKEFKQLFDILGIKYTVEPYNHTTGNAHRNFIEGKPCETCLCIPDPQHPYSELRPCFLEDGLIYDYIHNDWREPDQVPDDSIDEALL
jgi:hypothetical protein